MIFFGQQADSPAFFLAKVLMLVHNKKNISSYCEMQGESKRGQLVDGTRYSWTDCRGREKIDRSKDKNGTL